ncbi:MAG TPA: hypothetical protein DD640_02290 [Clostridiales bacterium]|nr:hypothetical protein [Clostridiales bacterium]
MAAADPGGLRQQARRVSRGGLLVALVLVFLIARHLAPTADLAFLALTSLCIAIAVIELDMRTALLAYLASALLSLAYPGLAAALPYIVLFGPYPLLRALIDSRFRRLPAVLVKLLAGNLLAGLAFFIFARADILSVTGKYGQVLWVVLPILLQMALLLFDFVLSLLIQFYMARLHRS